MMENINVFVEKLIHVLPLEIYSLIGGLIEEVIAPIPSPLVMTSAGSFAFSQGKLFGYLFFISLLAAIGKTIGSWLLYFVTDKAEDLILNKFGKFLGVSSRDVESIGKHFDNSWKDDAILIFLRAFPLIPGAPVSVVAGLIKMNMKTFLRATFVGVYLRSFLFAYIGYEGVHNFKVLMEGIDTLESIGKIIFILVVVGALAWGYKMRSKGDLHSWINNKFKKKTNS